MAVTITITPGELWPDGRTITLARLRAAAKPTGSISGLPLTVAYATASGSLVAVPSSNTYVSFTHGLGAMPKLARVVLVCTDAGGDVGYAENDEVDLAAVATNGSTDAPIAAVMASATVVRAALKFTTAPYILSKDGAGAGQITASKWRLKAYAFL